MIPGDVEAQKMNKSFPCGSSLRVSNLLHLLQCQTSLNAPAFMQHLLPLWPFFLSRLISPLSGPAQYIPPHNCLHPTSIFHSLKKIWLSGLVFQTTCSRFWVWAGNEWHLGDWVHSCPSPSHSSSLITGSDFFPASKDLPHLPLLAILLSFHFFFFFQSWTLSAVWWTDGHSQNLFFFLMYKLKNCKEIFMLKCILKMF